MTQASERKRKLESTNIRKSDENHLDSSEEDELFPENKSKGDGFADTILNLLKQDTGLKIPVLSGRSTKLMKQLRTQQLEERDVQKKRIEKRRKIEEKMILPSENNIEMERQLRKLATKGVVALFNAVAKAKKDLAEASEKSAVKETKEIEKNANFASKASISPVRSQQVSASTRKWNVVNENSTEDILLDWDKDESI